jgi:hypothetical protein
MFSPVSAAAGEPDIHVDRFVGKTCFPSRALICPDVIATNLADLLVAEEFSERLQALLFKLDTAFGDVPGTFREKCVGGIAERQPREIAIRRRAGSPYVSRPLQNHQIRAVWTFVWTCHTFRVVGGVRRNHSFPRSERESRRSCRGVLSGRCLYGARIAGVSISMWPFPRASDPRLVRRRIQLQQEEFPCFPNQTLRFTNLLFC